MISISTEIDVLGIDISKAKFDVALLRGQEKIKSQVFTNDLEGFTELQAWLISQGVTNLHACMEATSIYGNALARFLVAAGYKDETWEKIQDLVIDYEWKLIDDSTEEWYFRPQIVDRFYLLRDEVIADSDKKEHTEVSKPKMWSSNSPNFTVVPFRQ